MNYSEQETVENFLHLQMAVDHMEKGNPINEEWIQEQKDFIMQVHDHFGSDFTVSHAEIQATEFRNAMKELTLLINHLMDEITDLDSITIPVYRKFCKLMMYVIDYHIETDELADLMSDVTMK